MDWRNTNGTGTLGTEIVSELSPETRLRIAEEIKSLEEEDSNGRDRFSEVVISGCDEERLHSLIRSTLKQVSARGGFIRHIPLFEERSEYIRKQIQSHKEELVSLHSEIQQRERLLRRCSPAESDNSYGFGSDDDPGRGEENGNSDEEREKAAMSIRTEIRSASSRARWIREEIVTLAENFSKCVDTLVKLSQAATRKESTRVPVAESPQEPAPEEPTPKGSESRMVAAEGRSRRRTNTVYRES